jgi:hypothetical protein
MIASSNRGPKRSALHPKQRSDAPRSSVRLIAVLLFALVAASVSAQEPPPRIPFVAVDLHGTVPRFPSDPTLAASRNMVLAELPGPGLGVQVGLHFYPVRWRMVTFGIGGEVTANRSRHDASAENANLRGAEEKFLSAAPQLSFNFGSGHGWSYLSGGIGLSQWSLIPDDRVEPLPGDTERLKTINYGGGARWFAKQHLAFSFDVRFYAINPGSPTLQNPGSPRTTLMVIAAGISLK